MAKWSISNHYLPISYLQFKVMALEFRKAADECFGEACKVEINLMHEPALITIQKDPALIADLKIRNRNNTFMATSDVSLISRRAWKKAEYVEINIRPTATSTNAHKIHGHAEFKGNRPHQANFELPTSSDQIKEDMFRKHRYSRHGDGQQANAQYVVTSYTSKRPLRLYVFDR